MTASAYTFFVTESEYVSLQGICPDDFPFTYRQFVARVEEGTKAMAAEGIKIKRVHVKVADFVAWCGSEHRAPNNLARSEFAAIIGAKAALS